VSSGVVRVLICAIGSVAASACVAWNTRNHFVTLGCVASVARTIEDKGLAIPAEEASLSEEWVPLSSERGDELLRLAGQKGTMLDCYNWKGEESLSDSWGRLVRVEVSRHGEGSPMFRLRSYGADGQPGTTDDLVTVEGPWPKATQPMTK
jgi:hypothetical protein